MSEEKFTIQEIRKFIQSTGTIVQINKNANYIIWDDEITPENIRKANEPPVNKHQIKLDI